MVSETSVVFDTLWYLIATRLDDERVVHLTYHAPHPTSWAKRYKGVKNHTILKGIGIQTVHTAFSVKLRPARANKYFCAFFSLNQTV